MLLAFDKWRLIRMNIVNTGAAHERIIKIEITISTHYVHGGKG